MGNKASSSSSAPSDDNRVAFHNDEEGPAEEAKPKQQRGQRARKVLRQTSVAVKKAVISNSTVSDVNDISVKDTMELTLISKDLTAFPDAIVSMASLSILNLCKNQITEVPAEIGQVHTLTKLLLAGNQITELPEEIGQLSRLEELVMADNPKLSALPLQLAQCTNLKILHLARCRFRSVPEVLPQIASLLELDLSNNKLGKADLDFICSLDFLRSLRLNETGISALPSRLPRLAYLRDLEARGNHLTSLPDGIARLTNLTTLELENNDFSAIPEAIGDLDALKSLNFLGNPEIRTIPASLHKLRRLKIFIIEWSLLTNLNLREFQDKSTQELLDYLRLLADVEHGENVTAPKEGDDLRRILLENYARIVEKNKSRQMSKMDFYRSMGLENFPTNEILERMFSAFDTGTEGGDELVSFDEYAGGVELLLNGSLEDKASAFIRLFSPDPDATEIPIDVYVASIKSYQSIISMAILLQARRMEKSKAGKRASQGRPDRPTGLKKGDREEIVNTVTATDFWRSPEMQRILEEAQETFDVIDTTQDSSINKAKIIKFMKSFEGNEVEETLKAVANWLIHGIFQSPELLIAKAKEYLKAKQTEVALELFKDAIEAAPNRLNSYEELMQFYRLQKSFDKAIKVGKMALEVDDKALFILDLMGRVYGDAGRMQEAVQTYQKVIEINPDAAPTIYRQAWYQVALGQFKEAQANVILLDKLEYEAGAATIRYLISRASKDPAALVEKLGKRALRLNPDNNFLSSLISIAYDPKEDTKSIFG
jgi:Leucine-rich repeat (LRR) protein